MRLFIGIKTGCEDHLVSLQKHLRRMSSGNFTYTQNLHITLKFLGEVPPAKLDDIKDAMSEVDAQPFHLEAKGASLFGKSGIVSANVGGDIAALTALAGSLETAMEKCGFAKETRQYRPHITLARRFRANGGTDIAAIPYTVCGFSVNEIVLFESKRVDGRLVYVKLLGKGLG